MVVAVEATCETWKDRAIAFAAIVEEIHRLLATEMDEKTVEAAEEVAAITSSAKVD